MITSCVEKLIVKLRMVGCWYQSWWMLHVYSECCLRVKHKNHFEQVVTREAKHIGVFAEVIQEHCLCIFVMSWAKGRQEAFDFKKKRYCFASCWAERKGHDWCATHARRKLASPPRSVPVCFIKCLGSSTLQCTNFLRGGLTSKYTIQVFWLLLIYSSVKNIISSDFSDTLFRLINPDISTHVCIQNIISVSKQWLVLTHTFKNL